MTTSLISILAPIISGLATAVFVGGGAFTLFRYKLGIAEKKNEEQDQELKDIKKAHEDGMKEVKDEIAEVKAEAVCAKTNTKNIIGYLQNKDPENTYWLDLKKGQSPGIV